MPDLAGLGTFSRRVYAKLTREKHRWAKVEARFVLKFLRHFDVDCVFDVGANRGQYATRLRKAGYRGLIISFEPHPVMAAHLRTAAAGDERWIVREEALDSIARTIAFSVPHESEMSSLHAPSEEGTARFWSLSSPDTIDILTTTLADIYPELKDRHGFRRPYLKLDTQGHDMEVVRGAGPLIDQFVGLQSELAFTKLYQDSPDYGESLSYYQSLGFRLSGLLANNEGHFPDLLEMDCVMYRA